MKKYILFLVMLTITARAADNAQLSESAAVTTMVNTPNKSGRTPMHAIIYGATNLSIEQRHEAIRTLVKFGGSINAQDDDNSLTPLHLCIIHKMPVETVQLLLELGADRTLTTKAGYTPFLCAIENGFVEYMKPLLSNGQSETPVQQTQIASQ